MNDTLPSRISDDDDASKRQQQQQHRNPPPQPHSEGKSTHHRLSRNEKFNGSDGDADMLSNLRPLPSEGSIHFPQADPTSSSKSLHGRSSINHHQLFGNARRSRQSNGAFVRNNVRGPSDGLESMLQTSSSDDLDIDNDQFQMSLPTLRHETSRYGEDMDSSCQSLPSRGFERSYPDGFESFLQKSPPRSSRTLNDNYQMHMSFPGQALHHHRTSLLHGEGMGNGGSVSPQRRGSGGLNNLNTRCVKEDFEKQEKIRIIASEAASRGRSRYHLDDSAKCLYGEEDGTSFVATSHHLKHDVVEEEKKDGTMDMVQISSSDYQALLSERDELRAIAADRALSIEQLKMEVMALKKDLILNQEREEDKNDKLDDLEDKLDSVAVDAAKSKNISIEGDSRGGTKQDLHDPQAAIEYYKVENDRLNKMAAYLAQRNRTYEATIGEYEKELADISDAAIDREKELQGLLVTNPWQMIANTIFPYAASHMTGYRNTLAYMTLHKDLPAPRAQKTAEIEKGGDD